MIMIIAIVMIDVIDVTLTDTIVSVLGTGSGFTDTVIIAANTGAFADTILRTATTIS